MVSLLRWNKSPKIEIASIFIWNGKAYFPVLGKTNVGFFWDTDQLLVSDLTFEQMSLAFEKIIKIGNPSIPHPSQEEFRKRTPLQMTLKMTSYKKMAREGVICTVIDWGKENIGVAFSPPDATDIQNIDYKNQKEFDLNTSTKTLLEYVIEVIVSRS